MATIKKLAVFCGSSSGHNPVYAEVVEQLSAELARHQIDVIYGGAKIGLMGVLANSLLRLNQQVIGVMPQALRDVEISHPELTSLHIVTDMHERKAKIAELADGFIMLPGGPGSLEEFFEMMTWAQLGIHRKPCAILNINNYFAPLLEFLQQCAVEGFMAQEHIDMLIVEKSPQDLLSNLLAFQANYVSKLQKFGAQAQLET